MVSGQGVVLSGSGGCRIPLNGAEEHDSGVQIKADFRFQKTHISTKLTSAVTSDHHFSRYVSVKKMVLSASQFDPV